MLVEVPRWVQTFEQDLMQGWKEGKYFLSSLVV